MENTLISPSKIGASALWRRQATEWGHKVEEVKLTLIREGKVLDIQKCRRTSLLAALKTVGAVYAIVSNGNTLFPPSISFSDIKCPLYVYSKSWIMRTDDHSDFIPLTGRPPRPKGRWMGLGGLIIPGTLSEDVQNW